MHSIRKVVALVAAAATVFSLLTLAHAQGQQPAGSVTAELPQGNIVRGGQTQVAVINMVVLWEDLVRTTDRGRVRITLTDSSILNVGSNSNLRVTKHEATTRETQLELTVGKMRSRLQRLGPKQKFEVKTSTAVIGAVGTDFFVEATPQFTRVIVYEGAVIVSSLSAAIVGSQTVLAGNQTTVFPEQPPSSPQPASRADIQQSQDDTDVGGALVPPPPPRKAGLPPLLKNKWFWIVAGAATAVTVGIVVGTRGKRDVTGCPVPSSAPSSSASSSVSIAALTCPP